MPETVAKVVFQIAFLITILIKLSTALPLISGKSVPFFPEPLIEEAETTVANSEDTKEELLLKFSTEEEGDSKQMQERNDRYNLRNNAAGLIPDKQSEEAKKRFISKSESAKEVKKMETEEFLGSLTDQQKKKLDELHEGHHRKENESGVELPDHHPQLTLEDMKKMMSSNETEQEISSHERHNHDLPVDHQGPPMPNHDIERIHAPRNKIEQVHLHSAHGGAGPEFPDHDIGPVHAGHEASDDEAREPNENNTRARKEEVKPEELDQLAKTIQLTNDLKGSSENYEVLGIEEMLEQKVADEETRKYLKLMMKEHIFPKRDVKKAGGRIISDEVRNFEQERADEEKIFKSIELEGREFLALINSIIRDEKIHMTEEYFNVVQQKVMSNAKKSVDFATRQLGMDRMKEGRKSLKEWVKGFIKFHTPIIHDEN